MRQNSLLPSVTSILKDVQKEVHRAEDLHPPIASAHEAHSIILEELDEFWKQVKKKAHKRNCQKMRTELIQTAAMFIRTIFDVIDPSLVYCLDEE